MKYNRHHFLKSGGAAFITTVLVPGQIGSLFERSKTLKFFQKQSNLSPSIDYYNVVLERKTSVYSGTVSLNYGTINFSEPWMDVIEKLRYC